MCIGILFALYISVQDFGALFEIRNNYDVPVLFKWSPKNQLNSDNFIALSNQLVGITILLWNTFVHAFHAW